MAENTLVNIDIEGGRALLDQLAHERFPVRAAAWVHEPEGEDWRLYLVTTIRNRDLLGTYVQASEAILANEALKEELKRISFKIVDSRGSLGKTLIDWAKHIDRKYRRMSGSSTEGEIVDAVVYGKAA